MFLIGVQPNRQKPCPHIPLTQALLCPGLLPRVGETTLLRSPMLCPNRSLRHQLRSFCVLDKGYNSHAHSFVFGARFPESTLDLIFAQNLCLPLHVPCGEAGNLQAQSSPSSLWLNSPSVGLPPLPQLTVSARKVAGGTLPGLHPQFIRNILCFPHHHRQCAI